MNRMSCGDLCERCDKNYAAICRRCVESVVKDKAAESRAATTRKIAEKSINSTPEEDLLWDKWDVAGSVDEAERILWALIGGKHGK